MSKLCVALDKESAVANINLAETLAAADLDFAFKIGFRAFLQGGKQLVSEVKHLEREVIIDLKLHDIPNTMADAAEELAVMDIFGLTVHAAAGRDAIATVVRRLKGFDPPPKVFCVTVLTSFTDEGYAAVCGFADDATDFCDQMALMLIKESERGGADGSVVNVSQIANAKWHNMLTLVPGIRNVDGTKHDQKRTGTAKEAATLGADYIVVGRAICLAPKPIDAAKTILDQIAEGGVQ